MILTCPECATSYFVEDSRIPSAGRRVRCSSCGHRWLAGPEGPIAEQPAFPVEPEDAPVETAEAQDEPVAREPKIEAAPFAPAPAPVRRPAAGSHRRPPPAGRSSALVWAAAAALAAALIAGAIVFREQIVQIWPKSSAAYAGLGLSVGGGGLVLEQVRVEPAFLAGRPVLAVTGAIRNLRDAPVNAPPVRLTLLNRAGKPVEAMIARPVDAAIPAHGQRHFAVTLLDPPAGARDLEVRFETAADDKAAARATAAVSPPAAPPASVPTPLRSAAPLAPAPALSPAAASEHG